MTSSMDDLSPQDIADMEQEWKEERMKITLWQSPSRTLYLFFAAACRCTNSTFKYLVSHPVMLRFLTPLFVLWFILEFVPGPHTEYINNLEFCIEYIVWWVGLGILSSIGLGSGLQTGVLFLFPHIMRVCLTAQTCKSVNFKSFEAIWFRHPHDLFRCHPSDNDNPPHPATFLSVWFLVLVPSFLQATGTAIGEIPPYWMTRAAREAAIEAGDRSEVPEELETNSKFNLINRIKGKMISFLRTHGFLGVFLMAAWPNFAFDLCGICCGHFLMPFWTFFGATFVGKACVRNSYQTLLMVALFSEKYLEVLIRTLQRVVPDSFQLDTFIREALEDFQESSHKELQKHSTGGLAGGAVDLTHVGVDEGTAIPDIEEEKHHRSTLAHLWSLLLTVILVYFTLSCIQHFAQFYQAMVDKERSDAYKAKLAPHIKKHLTSPVSGKIKLPPPTPKLVRKSIKVASMSADDSTDPARPIASSAQDGRRCGNSKRKSVDDVENAAAPTTPLPTRRFKSADSVGVTSHHSAHPQQGALFRSPSVPDRSSGERRRRRSRSPLPASPALSADLHDTSGAGESEKHRFSGPSSPDSEIDDDMNGFCPTPPSRGRIRSSDGVLAALDGNTIRPGTAATGCSGESGGVSVGKHKQRHYSYSTGGGLLFRQESAADRENSVMSGVEKSK